MSRHLAGAAATALIAIIWTSAAMAAPGKLCSLARGWVDGHCGGAKTGRLSTPARCARARAWLDDHCPVKAEASAERAEAGKAKANDDKEYKAERYASPPPRHQKRAQKAHTRVYVYEERPRRCCGSPVHYRQPRYKDVVFPVEFVPKPGWERALYSLHERGMR